jgi:hypothetical protein
VGNADASDLGFSVGQGDRDVVLQIGATANGGETGVGFALNVSGLDAAQAHKAQAAFKEATSSPDETRYEIVGSGFQYDEKRGPGFIATFSAGGGGN